MDKSTKHRIFAYIELIIGAIMFGAGVFLAIDSWGTISQIEAAGLLGQAIYEQQYNEAMGTLTIGVLLTGIGFLGVLNGLAEDLKSTLYELNGS